MGNKRLAKLSIKPGETHELIVFYTHGIFHFTAFILAS